ncbi:iron ABC transporter permease, partial [Planktomarina temperata]|nr:iron ABC transporter permease [Planktomarina temperata]
MNARVVLLLLWPITASAQGFAGLGTDVDGFSSPQRPAQFDFPTDHGPHYDYRIEWWYLTANLEGLDGTPYGLQWTLFRSALTSDGGKGWSSPQLWMGHAAVTTPDAHFVTERLARGGIGQAGVQADPFEAWIDDWQLVGPDFATLAMTASGPEFAYDMVLKSDGPLVFHGDEGYSVKSAEGQASFYYSQPFYAIEGTLILPTGSIEVAGDAWLDREWSSQPLSDNQTGWDWFSLSLEDGKLMGFRLRQTDGSYYTSATWIDPNGSATSYANGAFEADPVAISDVGGRD